MTIVIALELTFVRGIGLQISRMPPGVPPYSWRAFFA
jgi:hypothetical protein